MEVGRKVYTFNKQRFKDDCHEVVRRLYDYKVFGEISNRTRWQVQRLTRVRIWK